jgi:multidrug resistance efflux pump
MAGSDRDTISAAMQESVLQARTIHSDVTRDNSIRVASRQLADLQSDTTGRTGTVICSPLACANVAIGAVCIEFSPRHRASAIRQQAMITRTIEACIPVMARLLQLEYDKSRPLLHRTGSWLVSLVRAQTDTQRSVRRWSIAVTLAAIGLGLLVPMQMKINSDARIEGAVQRAVVSPTSGYLRAVRVRPGDRVKAGQVLASLGGRELMLERDRLAGLVDQYRADVSTAISTGDRTAMAVARSRVDQTTTELALVEEKLVRTQVRAPIDGVVIEGDLQQRIGAPIDRGQNLYTVAPANSWRVVIEVDEKDILQVRQAQQGALYLASLPWQEIPVQVTRISPAATVNDGTNFFEVQAQLGQAPAGIRPGLRGTVRLPGRRENLASRFARHVGYLVGHHLWRWQPW